MSWMKEEEWTKYMNMKVGVNYLRKLHEETISKTKKRSPKHPLSVIQTFVWCLTWHEVSIGENRQIKTTQKQWSNSANNVSTVSRKAAAAGSQGMTTEEGSGYWSWIEDLPSWSCLQSNPGLFSARTHLTPTFPGALSYGKMLFCTLDYAPIYWCHHWRESIEFP